MVLVWIVVDVDYGCKGYVNVVGCGFFGGDVYGVFDDVYVLAGG